MLSVSIDFKPKTVTPRFTVFFQNYIQIYIKCMRRPLSYGGLSLVSDLLSICTRMYILNDKASRMVSRFSRDYFQYINTPYIYTYIYIYICISQY